MDYWIFTFGQSKDRYGHMARKAVKIYADSHDEARRKMWDRYENRWGFQYSADEWKKIENDPERWWPMEEIVLVIDEPKDLRKE